MPIAAVAFGALFIAWIWPISAEYVALVGAISCIQCHGIDAQGGFTRLAARIQLDRITLLRRTLIKGIH